MCLTLANAAAIHHHTDPTGSSARGYTATAHHAGHLTPATSGARSPSSRRGPSPTSTAGTASSC